MTSQGTVTLVLPAIKSVLEEVEQCFLHHICDLNRKREDIVFLASVTVFMNDIF